MYYIIYETKNKVNGKFYIGKHQTENLSDEYIGSGKLLKRAIKKYGLENFERKILFTFDNKKEMDDKEREIVNDEFLKRDDVYNINPGGDGGWTKGLVTVKDKNDWDKTLQVSIDDLRYLNGDLIPITTGYFLCKDKNGNKFFVKKDDERIKTGELIGASKDTVLVKDRNNWGIKKRVSINDPDYLSGKWIPEIYGKIAVKDKNGNKFFVKKNDERFLRGELVGVNKGSKLKSMSSGQKKKISFANSGEKNGCFGTCWITKDNENKKIKKDDLEKYFSEGWIKGRK